MGLNTNVRPTRPQVVLGLLTLLAYGVGYPLALIGGSSVGWVLVTLGGLFLLALGVVTIRRINRRSDEK
ncbi:MAG: hypothetical protein WAN48_13320 [Actinomycetes bacterium]